MPMSKMHVHVTLGGLLAGAGCAGGGTGTAASATTSDVCDPITAQATAASAMWQGTVFTIVMENRSRGDILGNKDAPFINSLASQNAVAQGYSDSLVHPSEPNYIWLVAGQNFGIRDDNAP